MSGKYILPISKDISRCTECRYHIKHCPNYIAVSKTMWFEDYAMMIPERLAKAHCSNIHQGGKMQGISRSRASLYNVWPLWGNWPQILHGKSVTGQYVTVEFLRIGEIDSSSWKLQKTWENHIQLVVEFQPIWKKCSSKWIISPSFGVNIKNIWTHHLDIHFPKMWFSWNVASAGRFVHGSTADLSCLEPSGSTESNRSWRFEF